jgi:pyridoxamine 5'-phosphate oxidase
MHEDPVKLFARWFREAKRAGTPLPEAMALATADARGRPSTRMVLLRGFGPRGFVFYTNYGSRKARELAENPRAAFVFHWPLIQKQVRGEGRVERASRQESARYFAGRPRESRLSAWASPQSTEILDRQVLEEELARTRARFSGRDIPCPPFWGGFRIVLDTVEFWEERAHRLHDRVLFQRKGRGWMQRRLAP